MHFSRTCEVLAERAPQPAGKTSTRWYADHEIRRGGTPLEDSMLFVIDENGATKIVRERHWGKYVRRLRWDNKGAWT